MTNPHPRAPPRSGRTIEIATSGDERTRAIAVSRLSFFSSSSGRRNVSWHVVEQK
jgi:hypothetical protein